MKGDGCQDGGGLYDSCCDHRQLCGSNDFNDLLTDFVSFA